jgi:hypothetical protein
MPRHGSLTPHNLIGKLDVLHVECRKCDRRGRYRVDQLAIAFGMDGKLTDWLPELTKDCPRKRSPGLSDPCGARLPESEEPCGKPRRYPSALRCDGLATCNFCRRSPRAIGRRQEGDDAA